VCLPVNKRLDEWVPETRCDFARLQPPKKVEVEPKGNNKRKAVDDEAALPDATDAAAAEAAEGDGEPAEEAAAAQPDKRQRASTGSLRRDGAHDNVITRIKNIEVGVPPSSSFR
jgi:hypothetical protein